METRSVKRDWTSVSFFAATACFMLLQSMRRAEEGREARQRGEDNEGEEGWMGKGVYEILEETTREVEILDEKEDSFSWARNLQNCQRELRFVSLNQNLLLL
ncbi:hypothetical protein SAY87_020276 [Trapa incisa]|uniref:Uncharacterized protein n=1 Tax=Trapa incisa TaxID=236973 RepID=A0AAN7Q8K6_9MYRT|nr:hypothetical protein SAY87_020276 [Trapa incisa]